MQTEEMIAAFEGTRRNTNACESYFGALKYYGDMFSCASYNANAVTAARRDRIYGTSARKYRDSNCSKRRKLDVSSAMERKRARDEAADEESRLAELQPDLVDVIMRRARGVGKREFRAKAHAAAAAADAASLARRNEKIDAALEKQVKCYVKAQEALDAVPVNTDGDVMGRTQVRSAAIARAVECVDVQHYKNSPYPQVATLMRRVDAAVAAESSATGKRRVYVANIKRYSHGMGITAVEPKSFASEVDANIGKAGSDANLAYLHSQLRAAYTHIKAEKLALVNEPAVPELHRRALPTLGAPTLQRVTIEAEQPRDADELREAADEYRARARTAPARRRAPRPDPPPIDDSLVREPKVRVDVAFEVQSRVSPSSSLVVDVRLSLCASLPSFLPSLMRR